MTKQIIQTNNAPAPIGPYNQAIKSGNLLFVSGQVALKSGTNDLANADIIEETHQVLQNVKTISLPWYVLLALGVLLMIQVAQLFSMLKAVKREFMQLDPDQ